MTTNPKKDYKNNYNARKVAPSYIQKMTPKQNQEESEQNYHIFQLKLRNARMQNDNTSTPSSSSTQFPIFYDANHLYLMTIALIRKNKNNNTTLSTNHLYEEDLPNHNSEISSKFRR